jgi:hypothetical protein
VGKEQPRHDRQGLVDCHGREVARRSVYRAKWPDVQRARQTTTRPNTDATSSQRWLRPNEANRKTSVALRALGS